MSSNAALDYDDNTGDCTHSGQTKGRTERPSVMKSYDGIILGAAVACLLGSVQLECGAEEVGLLYNSQTETIPLTPAAQAAEMIQLPAGFRVDLAAAEPMVQNPIAMQTDTRGRLWVVENYTYAERAKNFDTSLRDRIIILEDRDGDNRFETRKVFWDGALKATSVEIGFGGIWVLAAPQLLFVPDRDQDDIPDGPPVVMLDGWNDDTIRHNIVNGLRWGPDGWLYGRHGIAGTSLVGTPETPPEHRIHVDCSIWRFHPVRHTFEVVARGTTNPWGMDWDDHGEMFFINTVIGHLWHVIPGAYYQRMYGEHFDSDVYELLPQTADHFHWDTDERWSDIRTLGVSDTTDAAGGGHAHVGMMIYLGDQWPAEYRGSAFTCNLHGRRLNRDSIKRSGATYTAHHEVDFMKTADPWFRGIELLAGADGGVFVADWSDLDECHENDGVHRTSGRIFKLSYGRPLRAKGIPDLARYSSLDLAELQRSSNEWEVRKSRRLLQERAATGFSMEGAVTRLQTVFRTDADVPTRLRAMWALHCMDATTEVWLRKQLSDKNEHVRVWAIKFLTDAGTPSSESREALEALALREPSGLVLTYLASACQRLLPAERWRLLQRLGLQEEWADDAFYPLMVWYGAAPAVGEYPHEALAMLAKSRLPSLRRHLARRLTEEIERQPSAVSGILQLLLEQPDAKFRQDVMSGMTAALEGWRKVQPPPLWDDFRAQMADLPEGELRRLAQELAVVFGDGRVMADLRRVAEEGGPPEIRRAALRSLVLAKDSSIVPLLQKLLGDRDLATDAIRGLAAFSHPRTAGELIQRLSSFRTPARTEAIATLTSRAEYALPLLEAVGNGEVDRAVISPFQLRQMLVFENESIRLHVHQHWPELRTISEAKASVIDELKKSLSEDRLQDANLSRGRVLFMRQCAKCHTLFDHGGTIGPNLTGAQRHNIHYLLENIVDPSATVAKNYQMSVIVMNDGRVLNGTVVGENERSVTLQTPDARMVVVREDIEESFAAQVSLMPDRLLDVLDKDEVRDLIGYLMSPQQVPLPGASISVTD